MRTAALVKRIIWQMKRDKRTLGLLFFAPLLVLTLMNVLFQQNESVLKVGVTGPSAEGMVNRLHSLDVSAKVLTVAEEDGLADEQLDAMIEQNGRELSVLFLNDDPSKTKRLKALLGQMTQRETLPVEASYAYGNEESTFFDVLSPMLIGFFVFFFVFLISGVGLLRERIAGTLERLLSSPVRRWEVVAAYLMGYGLFAVIQTAIVVLFAVNVLHMKMEGSIWHVFFINLLLAVVALLIGILLSAFAASEFQMVQFIPVVVIPQVFFAGLFPVETMDTWVQILAKLMPLYYAGDALKEVMYKGHGIEAIRGDVSVLALFIVVLFTLNVLALKKYRTL